MSDFWGLSDGDTVQATTSYESAGGSIEPIPDGTQVLASIDEAKWDSRDGEEYISLRWTVLQPDTYKNRKVFQKLWVLGNNPAKTDMEQRKKQGDNAKKMLAAIDTNAGGKLLAKGGKPTDTDLQSSLMGKPMILRLGVYDMPGNDGGRITGNWVQQVAAKSGGNVQEAPKPVAQKESEEDFIPF
jgi:hypothetical protein